MRQRRAVWHKASVAVCVICGSDYCGTLPLRGGLSQLSLQSMPSTDKPSTPGLCANANGFSLHTGGALWRRQHNNLSTCAAIPPARQSPINRSFVTDAIKLKRRSVQSQADSGLPTQLIPVVFRCLNHTFLYLYPRDT